MKKRLLRQLCKALNLSADFIRRYKRLFKALLESDDESGGGSSGGDSGSQSLDEFHRINQFQILPIDGDDFNIDESNDFYYISMNPHTFNFNLYAFYNYYVIASPNNITKLQNVEYLLLFKPIENINITDLNDAFSILMFCDEYNSDHELTDKAYICRAFLVHDNNYTYPHLIIPKKDNLSKFNRKTFFLPYTLKPLYVKI